MTSYQQFARSDTHALADLFAQTFDTTKILAKFMSLSFEDLMALELAHENHIAELISRTESQRPAYLRRIEKELKRPDLTELILLLAIIGQQRTTEMLELRDYHMSAVVPGAGNRDTCLECFNLGHGVRKLFETYSFPSEAFWAIGASVDPEPAVD